VTSLEQELNLSVICYRENEITDLRPRPDQEFHAGDEILVLASLDALQRLQTLNDPEKSA
jgi:Trk K+ transport system NAD-binding subunit